MATVLTPKGPVQVPPETAAKLQERVDRVRDVQKWVAGVSVDKMKEAEHSNVQTKRKRHVNRVNSTGFDVSHNVNADVEANAEFEGKVPQDTSKEPVKENVEDKNNEEPSIVTKDVTDENASDAGSTNPEKVSESATIDSKQPSIFEPMEIDQALDQQATDAQSEPVARRSQQADPTPEEVKGRGDSIHYSRPSPGPDASSQSLPHEDQAALIVAETTSSTSQYESAQEPFPRVVGSSLPEPFKSPGTPQPLEAAKPPQPFLEKLTTRYKMEHNVKQRALAKRREDCVKDFSRDASVQVARIQLGRLWRPHTKADFENMVKQLCAKKDLALGHERVFFALLYMAIKEEREATEWKDEGHVFNGMRGMTVKQKKVLSLLHALSKTDSFPAVLPRFANYLFFSIFEANKLYNMKGFQAKNVVRMYLATLRTIAAEEKVRIFLYDIFYFRSVRNHIFICILLYVSFGHCQPEPVVSNAFFYRFGRPYCAGKAFDRKRTKRKSYWTL